MRNLGREYFHFDADSATITGSDSGRTIGLGQRVTVKLTEAAPVTGGIALELVTVEGKAMASGPARGRGKAPKRKLGAAKHKAAKTKRKVARKRS
jgi:ribonuclease R